MKNIFTILTLSCVVTGTLRAEIALPSFFSDHMVVQRTVPVKVWGKALPGKTITVTFANGKARSKVSVDSTWQVALPAMEAGGPYTLKIVGDGERVVSDIMVGDVWVCSGQSNMEWTVGASKIYDSAVATWEYPHIRCISFEKTTADVPQWDVPSKGWQVATPSTIPSFTAVGWFFAKDLYQKYKVPQGLISSNWGGTAIELWISPERMADFRSASDRFARNAESVQQRVEGQKRRTRELENWKKFALDNDEGIFQCPSFFSVEYNDSMWTTMKVPAMWEGTGLPSFDGIVWFRRTFHLSGTMAGKELRLELGLIDDYDEVYINGYKVGSTDDYSLARIYTIPAEQTHPGINYIAIRVMDYGGGGGINSNRMVLKSLDDAERVTLNGDWRYKTGYDFAKMPGYVEPDFGLMNDWMPGALYNAMINSIISYPVKGFTWYQGEANASRAYEYRALFQVLITDWRAKWGMGELPFLFVQLANFMSPADFPTESEWAELREAQTMALTLPKTGMAVAIDIGEADDIHPKNKQDVGSRLALAARNIAFEDTVVYSGPKFQSMSLENGKILLTFEHIGSGLVARGGELKSFAIAGENRNFVWAQAKIVGNRIIVWSDEVADPVAVRYAWANNPVEANLYNQEGLPASPFRTDDWPGITLGK